jgi:hypothetical protein
MHTGHGWVHWIHKSLSSSPAERPCAAESLATLESLNEIKTSGSLFKDRLLPLSETIISLHNEEFSEPFLATEDDSSRQVHQWTAQLSERRQSPRQAANKQSWNPWIAILFLAIVTWIFIELGTAEMRSGSYDGRPGPTLRTQNTPATQALGKPDKRRQADKGLRLPRRTIER